MRPVIGIISYLPNEESLRNIRVGKLNNLLKTCNYLFNIPIMVIAQNWKDTRCSLPNVTLYHYKERLGIVEARRQLRQKFLDSEYDYLIMLDDDCELKGMPESGQAYLRNLELNPGKWSMYKTSLLKLFAISKEVFVHIDYPPGGGVEDPELAHQCFEDLALIKTLLKSFSDKRFIFKGVSISERSDSANDKNSTWWHKQRDKHEIGDITRQMVKENYLDSEGNVVWVWPERITPHSVWEY